MLIEGCAQNFQDSLNTWITCILKHCRILAYQILRHPPDAPAPQTSPVSTLTPYPASSCLSRYSQAKFARSVTVSTCWRGISGVIDLLSFVEQPSPSLLNIVGSLLTQLSHHTATSFLQTILPLRHPPNVDEAAIVASLSSVSPLLFPDAPSSSSTVASSSLFDPSSKMLRFLIAILLKVTGTLTTSPHLVEALFSSLPHIIRLVAFVYGYSFDTFTPSSTGEMEADTSQLLSEVTTLKERLHLTCKQFITLFAQLSSGLDETDSQKQKKKDKKEWSIDVGPVSLRPDFFSFTTTSISEALLCLIFDDLSRISSFLTDPKPALPDTTPRQRSALTAVLSLSPRIYINGAFRSLCHFLSKGVQIDSHFCRPHLFPGSHLESMHFTLPSVSSSLLFSAFQQVGESLQGEAANTIFIALQSFTNLSPFLLIPSQERSITSPQHDTELPPSRTSHIISFFLASMLHFFSHHPGHETESALLFSILSPESLKSPFFSTQQSSHSLLVRNLSSILLSLLITSTPSTAIISQSPLVTFSPRTQLLLTVLSILLGYHIPLVASRQNESETKQLHASISKREGSPQDRLDRESAFGLFGLGVMEELKKNHQTKSASLNLQTLFHSLIFVLSSCSSLFPTDFVEILGAHVFTPRSLLCLPPQTTQSSPSAMTVPSVIPSSLLFLSSPPAKLAKSIPSTRWPQLIKAQTQTSTLTISDQMETWKLGKKPQAGWESQVESNNPELSKLHAWTPNISTLPTEQLISTIMAFVEVYGCAEKEEVEEWMEEWVNEDNRILRDKTQLDTSFNESGSQSFRGSSSFVPTQTSRSSHSHPLPLSVLFGLEWLEALGVGELLTVQNERIKDKVVIGLFELLQNAKEHPFVSLRNAAIVIDNGRIPNREEQLDAHYAFHSRIVTLAVRVLSLWLPSLLVSLSSSFSSSASSPTTFFPALINFLLSISPLLSPIPPFSHTTLQPQTPSVQTLVTPIRVLSLLESIASVTPPSSHAQEYAIAYINSLTLVINLLSVLPPDIQTPKNRSNRIDDISDPTSESTLTPTLLQTSRLVSSIFESSPLPDSILRPIMSETGSSSHPRSDTSRHKEHLRSLIADEQEWTQITQTQFVKEILSLSDQNQSVIPHLNSLFVHLHLTDEVKRRQTKSDVSPTEDTSLEQLDSGALTQSDGEWNEDSTHSSLSDSENKPDTVRRPSSRSFPPSKSVRERSERNLSPKTIIADLDQLIQSIKQKMADPNNPDAFEENKNAVRDKLKDFLLFF
ncbi:hypothetical protein BLNAU_19185 [Blattamonas nauphoetae]|uniref:Uncharacterized protein n=1 Tax=Blattamonas nauphoetae TaxID=2049346 RepID=A0ABQ9X297_9EUKA|nr:hypothetical protein BLNAU_19185 [Blattamonas nauphoetae]